MSIISDRMLFLFVSLRSWPASFPVTPERFALSASDFRGVSITKRTALRPWSTDWFRRCLLLAYALYSSFLLENF
tara:strand:+ start:310 stop:534 length:225 start_codon:yes stop_codon:yes gene_type:complete